MPTVCSSIEDVLQCHEESSHNTTVLSNIVYLLKITQILLSHAEVTLW